MGQQVKFIDFDVWSLNQQWLHDYIDIQDSKAIKSAALSNDGTQLLLYRTASPNSETVADFAIDLITTGDVNLDAFIRKLTTINENNIVLVAADGSIKDSGIAITDVAKISYVDEQIAKAKTETTHLTKEIVTEIPDASNAKENVIYMLHIDDATGDDKYAEYMLIGGAVVMTGTTSIDLNNYYTKTEIDETLDRLSNDVDAIESDITTINTSINSFGDRITSLETSVNDIQVATEEEALSVFSSIFTM